MNLDSIRAFAHLYLAHPLCWVAGSFVGIAKRFHDWTHRDTDHAR